MRETWYVMEDGSSGDPRQIAPDEKGVLRHQDGRAVAYAPHGPRSRGVDVDASHSPLFGGKGDHDGDGSAGGAKTADMQAEQTKKPYKTRETKTRK